MNIESAREHITKAAGLLVNRFGHEADVFVHLTAALQDLQPDPAVRPAKVAEPVEAEPEPESVAVEEPEEAEEAEAIEPEPEEPEPETEAPKPKPRGRR